VRIDRATYWTFGYCSKPTGVQRLEDEDEWTIKVKLDDRDTTESTVEVEVRAIIVEVIRKSSSQRVMKTCQPVMQDAR